MAESIPDTVGYPLNEARRLIEEAGFRVELKAGGSSLKGKDRLRVIRQRTVGEKRVELTFACEMYKETTL